MAHFNDSLFQPEVDRLSNQEMADVQFHHLRDGCDGGDVVIGQAVTCVHLKPEDVGEGGPALQGRKFGLGVISGTPGAGPMIHNIITTGLPTIASVGAAFGRVRNHGEPARALDGRTIDSGLRVRIGYRRTAPTSPADPRNDL